MEGLRSRITGLLGTAVAVVVLLVLAVPSVASSDETVVHVRMPSATRAYLPVVAPSAQEAIEDVVAPSPEQIEQEFVTRLNDLRAAEDLSTLEVHDGLVDVARSWAAAMAADDRISHRTDLAEIAPDPDWVRVGENVGVGATVEQLHHAFVASPKHYENMVDPGWQSVGVGVIVVDGSIWVAVNFMEVQK